MERTYLEESLRLLDLVLLNVNGGVQQWDQIILWKIILKLLDKLATLLDLQSKVNQ